MSKPAQSAIFRRDFFSLGEILDQQLNQRWGDWLLRARGGDADAYQKLLTEMTALLRGYLYSRIHDPQSREDVAQEILLGVHKARATYDSALPILPWFFAIVQYKLTDFYRSTGRRRRLREAYDDNAKSIGDMSTTQADADSGLALLEHALASLPPKQRLAVTLLKVKGLTTKDAASAASMSVSALKVNAHRGYQALIKVLGVKTDS